MIGSSIADLSAFSRVSLGHLPTPLEPLDRLSAHLGGPRIWIKRDDCTGLATGGNKTRKLEFLLGEALKRGADTVITFGALQSNHARQTAAACARLGLECHLVLSKVVPRSQGTYERSGNVLLDRILGANLHIVHPQEAVDASRTLYSQLEARGRRIQVIPTGGSNTTGALGYVGCACELIAQAAALQIHSGTVLHASSSGGTQAGLAAGLEGTDFRLVGVNVSDSNRSEFEARITNLALETRSRLRGDLSSPIPIHVTHDFLGPAYGMTTDASIEAIRMLAQTEGIVADPVYSGKALAAMIAIIRKHELSSGEPLIFVHTGGAAAVSAYEDAF
jgi:L-cysteate sulfo-lyase